MACQQDEVKRTPKAALVLSDVRKAVQRRERIQVPRQVDPRTLQQSNF